MSVAPSHVPSRTSPAGQVRLVYSNRNAEQIILLDEARALLRKYPGSFRLRHCLSQPGEGRAALAATKAGKEEGEITLTLTLTLSPTLALTLTLTLA